MPPSGLLRSATSELARGVTKDSKIRIKKSATALPRGRVTQMVSRFVRLFVGTVDSTTLKRATSRLVPAALELSRVGGAALALSQLPNLSLLDLIEGQSRICEAFTGKSFSPRHCRRSVGMLDS